MLIKQDRLLVALFVVNGVTSFGGSMIDPLYTPFLASVLHASPTAIGWVMTTSAIGGLLAGVFVGQWGRMLQPRHLTTYGTLAVGLLMVVIYNQTSLPLVMFLTLIMFVPLVAASVGTQTMFQSGVSDRYRGRVYGALGTTIALLGLVALWLAGTLAELLGIVPMLSVAGGVTFFAGVLALMLLPKNAVHHPPVVDETRTTP